MSRTIIPHHSKEHYKNIIDSKKLSKESDESLKYMGDGFINIDGTYESLITSFTQVVSSVIKSTYYFYEGSFLYEG